MRGHTRVAAALAIALAGCGGGGGGGSEPVATPTPVVEPTPARVAGCVYEVTREGDVVACAALDLERGDFVECRMFLEAFAYQCSKVATWCAPYELDETACEPSLCPTFSDELAGTACGAYVAD